MSAAPAAELDPLAPDEIDRRNRILLGDRLLEAAIRTDVTPSSAMVEFFREHAEEERRYEAAVAQRLRSLRPPDPGILPVPVIRRVVPFEGVADDIAAFEAQNGPIEETVAPRFRRSGVGRLRHGLRPSGRSHLISLRADPTRAPRS
jgi:hypothetical protein